MSTRTLSRSSLSSNDTLLIALFVAIAVHLLLILGINFTMPKPEKISKSINITIANMPAKKAPKEARFLAQDNQIGAGSEVKKPQPPKQKLPSQGEHPDKPIKKLAPEHTVAKAAPKIITQAKPVKVDKPEKTVVNAPEPTVVNDNDTTPNLSPELLQQQIAQLGEEIRVHQQSADATKIKFAESVSTHKHLAAQYTRESTDKIERIGNMNYPQVVANKKGFSATLTMDIGINADGSIYSIIISKSSGNPQLDEAAKQIVRMSAPFPPLPIELLKELKVLAITRTWIFSDESGMTTQ